MISQNIEIIKDGFSKYYGNKIYLIIFFIALISIFLNEKNKENRAFLLYYPILMFIIVLNPFFVYILQKIVPSNVYYRFFWTIPFGVIIAYFGVELIVNTTKTYKKVIGSIGVIVVIACSGKFMYTNQVFKKVDNLYKLPNECIEITKIISDISVEEKKLMISTNLIGYIRQMDASIKLAYQRLPYENYEAVEIVQAYNSGDVEKLTNLCKQQKVNIIVYNNLIPLSISPSYFGYELYKQIPQYDIYVLKED